MTAVRRHFEQFEHGADEGVRGIAPTLEGAFEQAALALMAVTCDSARVEARDCVELRLQASDRELLLVDWLNALIFEMATRHMLFSRFVVHLDSELLLQGQAWGEAFDATRHALAVEPKGATFTELRVTHDDRGYVAQCVVDV